MKNKKDLILIALIAILTVYVILSKTQSTKDIKRLTTEIESKSDSLLLINGNYDSLRVKYDTIYSRLKTSSKQFNNFRFELDSITKVNVRNVKTLERMLEQTIERYDNSSKIDTANNDYWRF